MSSKRKNLLAFALGGALCAWAPVTGICRPQIFANPQDSAPKQDTRDDESAKKVKKDSRNDKTVSEKSKTEARSQESTHQEKQHPKQTTSSTERQAPQEHAQRPAAQGRTARPANAHYQFRSQDRPKLRQHFQAQLAHVNRANRPHIAAGVQLEPSYQTYIVPVPQEVIVDLAPPPPGYVFGFYDGYVIVYDPATFFVIDVIDLL